MYVPPSKPAFDSSLNEEGRLDKQAYGIARAYIEILGADARNLRPHHSLDTNPAIIAIEEFADTLPVQDREQIFKDMVIDSFAERGICYGRGDWILPAQN